MPAFIVEGGEVRPYELTALGDRDSYGTDWIYVEAADEEEALAKAAAWDAIPRDQGPAEVEMFIVAYRAGAVLLPEDAFVSIDDIADRAGVTRSTVQSWRIRHANFPQPLDDDPRWAWSDVARWHAIPRKPGRPRKA